MKKIIAGLIVLALMVFAGCATLKKKKAGQAPVEHESSTVRFTGYKTMVKVRASPAEVEQYVLELDPFTVDSANYNLKMHSPKKMEKPGDSAEIKAEVLKIPLSGKFILAHQKPGEELWFIAQLPQSIMGVVRLNLKETEAGTIMSVKIELQDLNPLFSQFFEAVNVQELMAKMIERGVARGQAHFDPSVTAGQLLEKGIRGEFYDTFYQGHKVSVWINASQKRVDDYLTDPKNWETYKQKYGLELTHCLLSHNPGPCPTRVRLFGIEYPIDSFPAGSRPGDLMSAYWVQKLIFCRIEIHTAAEQGGTRMSLKYLTDMPAGISEEGGNIIMSFLQVPQYVEQILSNVKKEVEGAG